MDFEKMMRYGRHLKALMFKNFLVKIRQRKCTLAEIFLPVYAIGILVFLKPAMQNSHYPEEVTPRGEIFVFDFDFHGQTVAVAPDTSDIKMFLRSLNEVHEELPNTAQTEQKKIPINFKYFETKEDLMAAYWRDPYTIPLAVVFENNPFDKDLRYEIKTNPVYHSAPATTELYAPLSACRRSFNPVSLASYTRRANVFVNSGNCPADAYVSSGFLGMQLLIDFTKMKIQTDLSKSNFEYPKLTIDMFPKEELNEVWMVDFKSFIPFYISMAISQFITYLLILIVGEKEKRIKEGMKIMGVKDSVYWPAWFILYAGVVLIISVIATIMLYAVGLFEHSNSFLIFLLVMLYGLTIILFAFVITAFFDKSRTAGLSGTFAANLPSLFYFVPKFLNGFGDWYYWGVSIINSSGFALAMDHALTLEVEGKGIQFHNLWQGEEISFGGSLIMMATDIILYAFLAYYLDNVIPSSHGTKRSPLFCLKLQYWFPNSFSKTNEEDVEGGNGMTSEELNCENIEPVPDTMKGKCAIRITNLHKTFQSCKKKPIKAVNGINLTIYEGQITAILGHNGAGKTTLFNILTGLTSPTEGTAHIFGMDIRNSESMEAIRSMTGVCPQHDILFDSLTPREHLNFYATIRNVRSSLIESEVEKTLNEIDLMDKADSPAKFLSGGQRRKLSVGIAVIGDPKIVILDEPTAGVDPYSRRLLWSLLQSKKEGKVILLTTHFMDEADILADRKAVVSKGRLRCCGSSLFLKNKFGIGYHLTLVLKDNAEEEIITELILRHVPEAEKARHHGKELSYILPLNAVNSFAPLFLDIEQHINNDNSDLKISSYGVSMTTLEEVFLLLEKNQDDFLDEDNLTKNIINNSKLQPISISGSDDAKKIDSESVNSESGVSLDMLVKTKSANRRNRRSVDSDGVVTGLNFEASRISPDSSKIFRALVLIRAKRLIREPSRLIMMFIAPILFSNLAYYILTQQTVKPTMVPLTLNADTYRGSTGIIALQDASDAPMSSILSDMDVEVEPYDGIFRTLLHIVPHVGALDVFSCCDINDAQYSILYNDTAQHSLPAIVNIMNNVLYREILGNNSNGTIWIKAHPFQLSTGQQDFSHIATLASVSLGAVILLMPVALCIDIVHDREMKARNQLRVNGLSSLYYFSTYFSVFASIMFAIFAMILGAMFFYDLPSLNGFSSMYIMVTLFILYTPASLLFVTCVTYLFEKADSAHSFMFNSFFMAGTLQSSLVWILDSLPIGARLFNQIHTLFSFISTTYIPFAMVYSVNKVYLNCHADMSCSKLTLCNFLTYEIFIMFVGLTAQIIFWSYVLMKLDERQGNKNNQSPCSQLSEIESQNDSFGTSSSAQYEIDGDDDVRMEENRVARFSMNRGNDSPLILLQKLRKEYTDNIYCSSGEQPNIVAIHNLSLAVEAGEVIGLLGHNGSGKTTTMKIITAEEAPSRGKVEVKGMNTNLNNRVVFKHIGYCPQEDALWKTVTVREHLELYAYIRGVPEGEIPILVDSYLEGLKMSSHADKPSEQCSGGTKRKLNFAIAMIGDPSIILLDEPSTGMDPSSKRFLWDTILASFKGKKGAILTTHSMEEADALCSRVGIMISGRLMCIGSTQRLKNLYGAGYSLEIKLKGGEHIILSLLERQDMMKKFVLDLFSQAALEECFEERMIFSVPQAGVSSLADCFKKLEEAKRDLDIEEYSFSQTTLEQVFLRFSHADDSNNQ
ncbi:hypothetical protein LSTR_LSTR007042 [Laodelphax striatellus]|uniref:ABC transporter domain-containing protein n=1 Tax=Laodelphax striatellus TaxID=195883 RepID=A0A482WJH5_LAOST|nr:hypothetical protein LSTR_LSTR007042 [Laodelphax striatellus]